MLLPEEKRGREPADTRADDDEIVRLLNRQLADGVPLAVPHAVRDLVRRRRATAPTGERRRICAAARALRKEFSRRKPCPNGECDAIEKIASRDAGHAGPPFSSE